MFRFPVHSPCVWSSWKWNGKVIFMERVIRESSTPKLSGNCFGRHVTRLDLYKGCAHHFSYRWMNAFLPSTPAKVGWSRDQRGWVRTPRHQSVRSHAVGQRQREVERPPSECFCNRTPWICFLKSESTWFAFAEYPGSLRFVQHLLKMFSASRIDQKVNKRREVCSPLGVVCLHSAHTL